MEKTYNEFFTIFGVARKKGRLLSPVYYGISFTEKRNFEEFFEWLQGNGDGCRHAIMLKYPTTGEIDINNSIVNSLVVSNNNKITIMPVSKNENENYLEMYDAGLSFQERLFQRIIRRFLVGFMIKHKLNSFDKRYLKVILPMFTE